MDTIEQNAAMVEKLILPFPLLSDPEGAVIKRVGCWDEAAKIAWPAIYVLGGDRVVRYAYTGVDYIDRPGDEHIFGALDAPGAPGEGT